MGSASTKEINGQLAIRNRLLEQQVRDLDHVDPAVKHAIQNVKKTRRYTNLVLSGGAVKGMAYVGVLDYLVNGHYLNNVKNIACSSIGSIFAVLYAIGYTVPEIKRIAEDLDPSKLASVSKNLVSDIFHVATEYGLNNGQHLLDTVTELIEKRTGDKHYTLERLWKEKGINLVVTATDINTEETIYFWYGRYPKMPLRILVRITCSLPGIFCPVIFDGHYLVDGGLLDNTPIHVFDGPVPADRSAKLNMGPVDPATLAIMLIGDLNPNARATEQGDVALESLSPVVNKISSATDFYTALINSMIDNGVKRYQRPSFWLRTIPVHVPAYPTYHMNLSKSQIRDMFIYGYESTQEFFET